MSKRLEMLRIARGELGRENGTRYGAKAGVPWCAKFVRWCAHEAAIPAAVIPNEAWCDDFRAYYIKDRRYFPRTGYAPKAGDIVCFHWGQAETAYDHVQHIGIVEAADQNYVYTIEGNSGIYGRVCAWKYPIGAASILGYCSPCYEDEEEAETPAIRETRVSVCEERPVLTRKKSDGSLVPTDPQSGILTVSVRGIVMAVLAGASLRQTRDQAAVFTFEVLPEEDFFEGDRVEASVDGTSVFCGFVFTKTRDEDGIIRVTAYDSLRYFKNRDTYVYEGKTAGELFRAVCRDHGIQNFRAEADGVALPLRVEDDRTLFDILAYAVRETEKKTGRHFVLRDECGCVTFREAKHCGAVLDGSNITGFSYTSSIDGSLNRVKTVTERDGVRLIRLVQDTESIRRVGLLQTVLKQSEEDLDAARELLASKAGVRRNLKLTVCGDTRLIAGDLVTVRGVWGDVALDHDFFIRSVTHTWDGRDHTASVTLEGGEFDA